MTTPTETPPQDDTDNAPEATATAPAEDTSAAEATAPAIVPAPSKKAKDPLHGITLEMILTSLVERHGWEAMGKAVEIKCFLEDPSIKSSLTFLRRTPWAREKVEHMFITNDLRPAWRKRGKGRGPRS